MRAENTRHQKQELKTLEKEFEAKLAKQGAQNSRLVVTIIVLAVLLVASLIALTVTVLGCKYRKNAAKNKNNKCKKDATQSDVEQGLLHQPKKEVETTETGTNTDKVHEDCVKESKLITQDTQCHPVSVDEVEGSQDPDNVSTPTPDTREIRLH